MKHTPPFAAQTAQSAGELARRPRLAMLLPVLLVGGLLTANTPHPAIGMPAGQDPAGQHPAGTAKDAGGKAGDKQAADKLAGDSAAGRLIAADALALTHHPDPIVRGEAALVLATTGDSHFHEAVLAVAKDAELPAQVRGILALGYLGTPGTEAILRELLAQSRTRAQPAGICAAFALGSLPEDQAPAAITDYLAQFLGSSMKRQRDVLLALLCALGDRSPVAQKNGLLQVLDDASNRDPAVRGALLTALARIPGALAGPRLEHALRQGSVEERRAALQACALHDEPSKELLPVLLRLCEQDPDPRSRALALAVLTRMRHLPTLDLAARAIRAGEPVEVAQGTRSALLLGGTSMRNAIEQQLATLSPARQAAVFTAFEGPLGEAGQALAQRLAGDRRGPLSLRIAAARALAQAEVAAALPVLRDVFLDARDDADLRALARGIVRLESPAPELARLHDGSRVEDLALQPERLAALLAANHPQAVRFCLEQLRRKDLDVASARGLLHGYRTSLLPAPGDDLRALLPAPLQEIL